MNEFEETIHAFLEIMRQPNIQNTEINLPKLDYIRLTRVLTSSRELFATEPNILELSYPIFIVGNINGSLFSLFEILKKNGVPPVSRYLFIGNSIGNDEFSYECLIFILSMKIVFPNHIFLIRGQNEFLQSKCFHYMQISIPKKEETTFQIPGRISHKNTLEHDRIIDTNLLQLFDNTFSSLPLTAKVFNRFLCVNRSIPISLTAMTKIDRLQLEEGCPLFQELYGNASNELITNHELFELFLGENSLTMIIRGANYVGGGVFSLLDGRITEVFSGINHNDVSAILNIISPDDIEIVELNQIPIVQRSNVGFVSISPQPSKQDTPTQRPHYHHTIDSTPIYMLNHPNTHFQSLEKIKRITRINRSSKPALSHMNTQPFFDLSSKSKSEIRSHPRKHSELTFG